MFLKQSILSDAEQNTEGLKMFMMTWPLMPKKIVQHPLQDLD